jgi:hypothetical protein
MHVNGICYSLIRWTSVDGRKNETWVTSETNTTTLEAVDQIDLEKDAQSPCNTTKDKRCTRAKIAGGFIDNQVNIKNCKQQSHEVKII